LPKRDGEDAPPLPTQHRGSYVPTLVLNKTTLLSVTILS